MAKASAAKVMTVGGVNLLPVDERGSRRYPACPPMAI
jgi:hypothetical protein